MTYSNWSWNINLHVKCSYLKGTWQINTLNTLFIALRLQNVKLLLTVIITRHKNSVYAGKKPHNQGLLKLPEELWNDDPCGCLSNQNILWNTGDLMSDFHRSEKEAKTIYVYFPSRNRSDKGNMHKKNRSLGILITKYSKPDSGFWQ